MDLYSRHCLISDSHPSSTTTPETVKENEHCKSVPVWTYVVIGIQSVIIVLLVVWLVIRIRCKKENSRFMNPVGGNNPVIRMKYTSENTHHTENDYEEVMLPHNDYIAPQSNTNNRESDARIDLLQELKQAPLPRYLPMSPIRRQN